MVLPEPFGPTSAATSPGRTVSDDRLQRRALRVGVVEAHVVEDDALSHRSRHGPGRRRFQHLRLEGEELVEVGEEEVVLVETGDAAQHALEGAEAGAGTPGSTSPGRPSGDRALHGLIGDVGEGAEDGHEWRTRLAPRSAAERRAAMRSRSPRSTPAQSRNRRGRARPRSNRRISFACVPSVSSQWKYHDRAPSIVLLGAASDTCRPE